MFMYRIAKALLQRNLNWCNTHEPYDWQICGVGFVEPEGKLEITETKRSEEGRVSYLPKSDHHLKISYARNNLPTSKIRSVAMGY